MITRLICIRIGYLALALCAGLTSCISSKELVLYQADGSGKEAVTVAPQFIPTIRVGDVLSVQVSSLSAEGTAFFNPYTTITMAERGGTMQQVTPTTPIPYTPGYLVGEDGQIALPLIGKQAVRGLTNTQAATQIQEKLLAYLKEPTVNVRNLNFQISVSGEVARPALFSVPNEQITLPAALGLAGDITIYGRRDNVLIIREENGQRTFNRVDLTRREVFTSPYYYLHPNDIIYVEPGKARITNADRTYQLLPIIISALSFVAIIVSRF